MASSQPGAVAKGSENGNSRSRTMRAALMFGLLLGVGILAIIHSGYFQGTLAERYVSHPVEWVEVVLFCCALGALGAKFLHALAERPASRATILPPWNGEVVPASEAGPLLAGLHNLPRRLRDTWLVRRARAVLAFLRSRNSAADLDDHLRTLTDNDSLAVENSYSLTRFICWAIPILGFLGTVLGITEAVAGVTPQDLENNLNKVTDGLALAFDTTALALALVMILMFLSFVTERMESGVLEAVDGFVDRELAHRFERVAGEGGQLGAMMRQDLQVLVRATEQLVQRQAEVWVKAIEAAETRWAKGEKQQQDRLTTALEQALNRTLQSHAQHVATLEKQAQERSAELGAQLVNVAQAVCETGRAQQEALAQAADSIVAQADVLGGLQEGERQLVQLQDLLNQNLAAIASVGTFEQAVHSLTAAVHMLSASAVQGPASRLPRRVAPTLPDDTGKAA